MDSRHVAPATRLRGTVAAPPDKSISHRAALLGAMASEPVRITGYLDAEDTNSTLAAVEALGALVDRRTDEIVVRGAGLREARETAAPIDVGNAGTLMRLLPGWLAGQEGRSFVLDGDASIRRRPVDRIAAPLRAMGAEVDATDERFPPFTVRGARLRSIAYDMPVASAQVKSCVLIAGLLAEDPTTVTEPQASRDHTERMLTRLGRRGPPQRAPRHGRPRRRARRRAPARARRPVLGGVLARRRRDRPRRGDPRDEHGDQLDPHRLRARARAHGRGHPRRPGGPRRRHHRARGAGRGRRGPRERAAGHDRRGGGDPARDRRAAPRRACSAASRRARRSSAAPRSCG